MSEETSKPGQSGPFKIPEPAEIQAWIEAAEKEIAVWKKLLKLSREVWGDKVQMSMESHIANEQAIHSAVREVRDKLTEAAAQ